jgi:chromosome segregation protein
LYLKKVDIQGFKSFAEKTEVEFNSKVTAIVGPNGSGKSNIADAIRWVLGEQSVKSLRGNRMEDVIFSGTEKRRALGFSEVTIVFDNSQGKIPIDYREVAVTRRMFRSGESEYYINKISCRLKDIRELFMDTGVGKEGYSIIGQGKIDEILSNKPEDRRNIFEEAAGIIKYKTRKQESLRKLEKTESNLSRIGDLIFEIRKQRDQLKDEAEKALTFQKHFNQLRNLDVAMSSRDLKRIRFSKGKLDGKESELVSERELLESETKEIECFFSDMKNSITKAENLIEEKREIKLERFQENESIKQNIRLLEEKEAYTHKEIERLTNEITDFVVTYKAGNEFVDNSKSELQGLESELESLNSLLNTMTVEKKSLQTKIEEQEGNSTDLREALFSKQGSLLEIKSESSTIGSFRVNIKKRILQLDEELKELETERTNSTNLRKYVSHDLDIKTDILKNEIAQIVLQEAEVEEMYSKKKGLDDNISELQKHLGSRNTTLELYKNLERDFDGYYGSVKSVAQRAANDRVLGEGYIGIVADLFSVEERFVLAIETALGSSIQHIAVENESSAKRMIQYLKDQKKGRATFLPVTSVKGQEILVSSIDLGSTGFVGVASNLIEYDKKLSGIFKFLLGRTIVFDNLDNALKYSKDYGYKHRVVTLEGDVINPGGSLTGGSTGGRNVSLLSRKQGIIAIEKEIIRIRQDLEKTINEHRVLTDKLNLLMQKLEDKRISVREYENSIRKLEFELISCSSDIDKFSDAINKRSREISSLRDELSQLELKEEKISTSTMIIDESLKLMRAEITGIEANLNSLYNERHIIDEKINSTKLEWNIGRNKADVLHREIESHIFSESNVRVSIQHKEHELENLKLLLGEVKSEKAKYVNQIESYSHLEQTDTDELKVLLSEKDTLMNSFYDLQERNRLLTQRLSKVEREIDKIDVDRAKYDIQIESIVERMYSDYDLDLDAMPEIDDIVENVREDQQTIKELRAKIKELGNVNLSSIEDYRIVSDRYEFLSGQLSDLNSAREDIQIVIRDMEKKMRVQFRKSFDEINNKFSTTFSTLFNGGKARLELESEDDILTSGIEIMAQPPGKKLQSLMLLSGGEKSLTAVALLFAILKTKPSPFCILDEIDAALDEANISRYTNYLKTFDDETQFVLITHRKTTMEIADVLYGVTMEEEGVSRMISLKLIDFSEAAV